MNEAVRRFLPFVDFLEAILGSNSEIVLHDFTDPDHSVVDIRNGWVSGRNVGAPATDLALKILHEGSWGDREFVADYVSHSSTNKPLQSASYFIRDGEEIVGMLCVNTDVAPLERLCDLTRQIASTFTPHSSNALTGVDALCAEPETASSTQNTLHGPGVERLTDSTQSLISRTISDLVAARGTECHRLGQEERIEIIRTLHRNGLFRLKGAVASAAEALGISEPSVYRYLQKIRKE